MTPTSLPTQRQRSRTPSGLVVGLLTVLAFGAIGAPRAVAVGSGSAGDAAGTASATRPTEERATKGGLSMDEAIDRAQKRFRARVVRAEQVERGGRVVYVLRLLSEEDGRVFTVRVDARSGDMQ
jgi:hypothetical protein